MSQISKMNSTFQCKRSVNNQLHNKICQDDEYDGYLRRIQNIVDRHLSRDKSPDFYMTFLHKARNAAKLHRFHESQSKIGLENKHLLGKILKSRSRELEVSQSYHLAMHEKRNRQIEKINCQNKKIASRITSQLSSLRKTLCGQRSMKPKKMDKKTTYAVWNYSPLKSRKLPKLVGQLKGSRLKTSGINSETSQIC